MKYPDKIYICRNMMCCDVNALMEKGRLTKPIGCDEYGGDGGMCLYDGFKCHLVEYQKVKK